jgi:hypothetical protein
MISEASAIIPVTLTHIRAGEGTRSAGSLIVAVAAVAFSTAGVFTRMISADVWTMLFWRGLFGGLLIAAYIVWRERGATWAAFAAVGRAGLMTAGCSTVGTICFIVALRQTTVADVTVIYATAPFLAAGIAWVWTRERPRHARGERSCPVRRRSDVWSGSHHWASTWRSTRLGDDRADGLDDGDHPQVSTCLHASGRLCVGLCVCRCCFPVGSSSQCDSTGHGSPRIVRNNPVWAWSAPSDHWQPPHLGNAHIAAREFGTSLCSPVGLAGFWRGFVTTHLCRWRDCLCRCDPGSRPRPGAVARADTIGGVWVACTAGLRT